MKWILLVTLMSNNQGSMTTVVFSDLKSCMKAGHEIKEVINDQTPLFKNTISYKCISSSGL